MGGADTERQRIRTECGFGRGKKALGALEFHTVARLASRSRLACGQGIEQRRHESLHEQGVARLVGVIDIGLARRVGGLIAVRPLAVALTIVQRPQEIDRRNAPLLHLEIHALDKGIVGSVVVAARVVVGGNHILVLRLEEAYEAVHIVFPLVVDGLWVGSAVQALVAQSQTDDHIAAAIAEQMALVAGEQIGGFIAIDRRIGILVVGEQLAELPSIAVLDNSVLGCALPIADRRAEEGDLIVRNRNTLNGIGEMTHIERNLFSAVPHGDVAQGERCQRLVGLVADHALDPIAGLDRKVPRRIEAELPALLIRTRRIGHQIDGVAPYAVPAIGQRHTRCIPSRRGDVAHDAATVDLDEFGGGTQGIETHIVDAGFLRNRAAIQRLARLGQYGKRAALGQRAEGLEIVALGCTVLGDTIHIDGAVLNACALERQAVVLDGRGDARKLLHTHTVDGQKLAARAFGHPDGDLAHGVGENRIAEIDLTHILIDARSAEIGARHLQRARGGGQPLDVVFGHTDIRGGATGEDLEAVGLGLVQPAQHQTATLRIGGKEIVARGIDNRQIAQLVGIGSCQTACTVPREQIARVGKVQRGGRIVGGNQRIVRRAADLPRGGRYLGTDIVPIMAVGVRIGYGGRIITAYHAKIEIERAFERLLRRQRQRRQSKKRDQKCVFH